FTDGITIGVTRHLEGQADYLLGTALLAGARAIEPWRVRGHHPEVSEQRAQAEALRDLARDQLARVAARNPELGPRARLRMAQVALAAGSVSETQELQDLAQDAALSELEQSQVGKLAEFVGSGHSFPTGHFFPTLKRFREHLLQHSFHAVILTDSL